MYADRLPYNKYGHIQFRERLLPPTVQPGYHMHNNSTRETSSFLTTTSFQKNSKQQNSRTNSSTHIHTNQIKSNQIERASERRLDSLKQRGEADVDVEGEHPVSLLALHVHPLLPHLRGHVLPASAACSPAKERRAPRFSYFMTKTWHAKQVGRVSRSVGYYVVWRVLAVHRGACFASTIAPRPLTHSKGTARARGQTSCTRGQNKKKEAKRRTMQERPRSNRRTISTSTSTHVPTCADTSGQRIREKCEQH